MRAAGALAKNLVGKCLVYILVRTYLHIACDTTAAFRRPIR